MYLAPDRSRSVGFYCPLSLAVVEWLPSNSSEYMRIISAERVGSEFHDGLEYSTVVVETSDGKRTPYACRKVANLYVDRKNRITIAITAKPLTPPRIS